MQFCYAAEGSTSITEVVEEEFEELWKSNNRK
jgi:hypothetical protein